MIRSLLQAVCGQNTVCVGGGGEGEREDYYTVVDVSYVPHTYLVVAALTMMGCFERVKCISTIARCVNLGK
jgi:hypothetical protein